MRGKSNKGAEIQYTNQEPREENSRWVKFEEGIYVKHPFKPKNIPIEYTEDNFLEMAKEYMEKESLDTKHPCATVFVSNEMVVGKGANGSEYHPKYGCDRKKMGIPTAQQYELCEGCHPKNHSEPTAIKKAKKEALKIVKEAKKESEEVIDELRNMKAEIEEKVMNRQIEASKKKINTNIENLHDSIGENLFKVQNNKAPVDLKPGETVKILSLNQIGYVVDKEDEKGQVLVQVGIMKVKMNASNLKREKEEKRGTKTGVSKILNSRKANIKREIDLRGQNLEEAMLEVDKFIDDCYLVGVTPITIIHGVGTGVLAAGIKQMLKKNGHVKKQRQGKYGEGGIGVTIVDIKN